MKDVVSICQIIPILTFLFSLFFNALTFSLKIPRYFKIYFSLPQPSLFNSCVSVDDEQFFLFPFPLPFFLLFARCHQRLHPSSDDDIVGLARQPPPHQTRITLSSLPAAAKNIAFFLSFALCFPSPIFAFIINNDSSQPTNIINAQQQQPSCCAAFLPTHNS